MIINEQIESMSKRTLGTKQYEHLATLEQYSFLEDHRFVLPCRKTCRLSEQIMCIFSLQIKVVAYIPVISIDGNQ